MVIAGDEKIMLKRIFASDLGNINFGRLTKTLMHMKDQLIDFGSNMYLNVNSVINKSTIISGSNDTILRKFNVKQNGYVKMYIDQDLIEDKLYELIRIFNLHFEP